MIIAHQPKYSESPHKFMARELILRLYRFLTGRSKAPENKFYLTLANIQDKSPTSEINQVIGSGLFKKKQFVGIDYNKWYINKNKRNHPEATFICDDWNVFLSRREFDPALVYLDSTHFGDKLPALKTLKNTLDACEDDTLVICNVMETNPRSGLGNIPIDTTVLVKNLLYNEPPSKYKDWNKENHYLTVDEIENSSIFIPAYKYQTSKTLMKSYVFYKGIIPSKDMFEKEFKDFTKWCDNFEKESVI